MHLYSIKGLRVSFGSNSHVSNMGNTGTNSKRLPAYMDPLSYRFGSRLI